MFDKLPLASPPVRRNASSAKWETSPLSRLCRANRCCRYWSISAVVIVIPGSVGAPWFLLISANFTIADPCRGVKNGIGGQWAVGSGQRRGDPVGPVFAAHCPLPTVFALDSSCLLYHNSPFWLRTMDRGQQPTHQS